jgi:hypothetical protein
MLQAFALNSALRAGKKDMLIQYELSPQDLMKIYKHQRVLMQRDFAITSFWGKLLWSMVLIVWLVPTGLFVANLPRGMGYWLLCIVLPPIIVLVTVVFLQKRILYRLTESAFPPSTTRTIAISDRGIDATAGQSSSSTSWNEVKEILELPEYVLFVLPLLNCIAVPTRAFGGEDQLAGFITEAHTKMTTALNHRLQPIANKAGSG